MKKYVLGFAFEDDNEWVLLIKKERPQWQKGFYNGLGGHIEEGETHIQAMVREFEEECSVRTKEEDWEEFSVMKGENWICYCFKSFTSDLSSAKTTTDEQIQVVGVSVVPKLSTISNLPFLIHLALDPVAPKAIFDYNENAASKETQK